MTLPRKALAVAAALQVLVGTPLVAQTTGRILGTVLDSSGAPAPGAVVAATSPSFLGGQQIATDERGEFRFLAVPPGVYSVRVDLQGFKSVEQRGVVVGLGRTLTLAFRLELETISETLNVLGVAHGGRHEHHHRRQCDRRAIRAPSRPARRLLAREHGPRHAEGRGGRVRVRLDRGRERIRHRGAERHRRRART